MSDPLTIVRNQLQTALEKIAWIEKARSKTLPDDHFLSVDMTVETVRYLSNLVNSFSDDPEFDELVAEQHVNRVLSRNVLEAQAERDRYKRALADLLEAFTRHRTETHKQKPTYCETCEDGAMGIERARAALAGSSDAGGTS